MWVKGFVTGLVLSFLVAANTAGQESPSGRELKAREIFISPIGSSILPSAPSRAVPAAPSAAVPAAIGGLALRYTLFQGMPNKCEDVGAYSGVDPEAIFRNGDCIRVAFEVNASGYFYVVSRGSSGTYAALPLSGRSNGIESRIEPCQTYEFPADTGVKFTGLAGEERLYLVVAREPVDAFHGRDQAAIQQALGLTNSTGSADHSTAGWTTRDIVIEKVGAPRVDLKAAQPAQAAARDCGSLVSQSLMYVAAGRPDLRRVVADIKLIHR